MVCLVIIISPLWIVLGFCCSRILLFKRRALNFIRTLLCADSLFVFIEPPLLAVSFHTRQACLYRLHLSFEFRKCVTSIVVRKLTLRLWKQFRKWTIACVLLIHGVFMWIMYIEASAAAANCSKLVSRTALVVKYVKTQCEFHYTSRDLLPSHDVPRWSV